jgi:PIN domain nuclease of toxin-antitoxin system
VTSGYILDTHASIFALVAPSKLGRKAAKVLERVESGHEVGFVPAAVVAEVVILRELGKITIGLPQLRNAFERAPGLRFLAMDIDQLDEFAGLGVIRDPFDRLIVSAARALGARLITRDADIEGFGLVETIWS